LKFSVPMVTKEGTPVVVESGLTEPLIVITNTKQWEQAQGILTKKDLFTRVEISATEFCNFVQFKFIRDSRVDPRGTSRALIPEDFEFLFKSRLLKKFEGNENVTGKEFDRFWDWYGPVLQKMHHHKVYVQMWMSGIFWGFISESDAEILLQKYNVGTFLFRWSEKVGENGSIVMVSAKLGDFKFDHFVLDTKDLGGCSLIRLAKENRGLIRFLKITVTEELTAVYSVVDKVHALQNFNNSVVSRTKKGSYDILDVDDNKYLQ